MSQLRSIEWDACLLEPRPAPEVVRRYRRETGRPDRTIHYFADSPWLVELLIAFSLGIETRVALDPELADLAGLVVSQDNSCRYCFAAMRAFLRILGMPEQRIARLQQDLLTADFDPRERAALDFARRLSRSNPPPSAADVEALRVAGFSDLEIAELVGVVGLHLFFNRLATLSALPPWGMEEFPDRWHTRLMRPLMALRLRGVRRRAPLEPLRPDEKGGPFGPVVEGLDGLPLARTYRAALEGMWQSPPLSRRTKALVFAVVGRALECPLSEQEGRRLALSEGMRDADFDEVLSHLASPALDPVESIAVPFARETVWYQPARIQKRAREVMAALTREQFTELIAVASLANALCRIAPVLQGRR
jgi:AhpD family alkylhydroperoxidase